MVKFTPINLHQGYVKPWIAGESNSRQVDERDGGSCNANANDNVNIAIAIEKSYLDQNQEQGQNQAKTWTYICVSI